MLSVGEDVEASALSRRGWSISAIARHLDRDRKTVRAYLAGEREPGVRRPAAPDPLAPFAAYVTARCPVTGISARYGASDLGGPF